VPVPHVSYPPPAVAVTVPDAATPTTRVVALPNVDVIVIVVLSAIVKIQYCWLPTIAPKFVLNWIGIPTYMPAVDATVILPFVAIAVAVVVTIPAIDKIISSIVVCNCAVAPYAAMRLAFWPKKFIAPISALS
jgi:hypothetical protein